VLKSRVWRRLLGLSGVKIVDVDLVADELVVRVALHRPQGQRCGACRRHCPRYDRSRLRRRWRSLDLGTTKTFIEAEVIRVSCPDHGVVTERVPWAAHDSRFTKAFEEQAAWLAVECSKTAVAHLMRVSWRTVGRILERVATRLERHRMTRGHRGSLLLRARALPSPPTCRLVPARLSTKPRATQPAPGKSISALSLAAKAGYLPT